MRISVTVAGAQRINVPRRVEMSPLQLAKKQSNVAGAENRAACEHVACSVRASSCETNVAGCLPAVISEGKNEERHGKPCVASCGGKKRRWLV